MPNCCTECFVDDYLKEYITSNGQRSSCDYCGSRKVHVIAPKELTELFNPLVSLYTIVEDFMWMEELKEYVGRYIWEVLSEDWEIFVDSEVGKEIMKEMFTPFDPSDPAPPFLSSWVENEDEYTGHSDDVSDKQIEKWNEFKKEIISKNRFFLKKQLDLDRFRDLLGLLSRTFKARSSFFRARVSLDEKVLPPSEMGSPPKEKPRMGGQIQGAFRIFTWHLMLKQP